MKKKATKIVDSHEQSVGVEQKLNLMDAKIDALLEKFSGITQLQAAPELTDDEQFDALLERGNLNYIHVINLLKKLGYQAGKLRDSDGTYMNFDFAKDSGVWFDRTESKSTPTFLKEQMWGSPIDLLRKANPEHEKEFNLDAKPQKRGVTGAKKKQNKEN